MSETFYRKLFWAGTIAAGAIFLITAFLLVWGRWGLFDDPNTRIPIPNENRLLTVLVVSILAYLIYLLTLNYMQAGLSKSKSQSEYNGWFVFGTLISGMLVVGALVLLATGRLGLSTAPEIQTGIVIVLAVSVLTLLLFILTLGFQSLGLSNAAQPLALPSGSVRAFIALMLIMIFVILSVYAVRFVGEGVYTDSGIYSSSEYLQLAKTAEGDGDHLVRRQVQCPPEEASQITPTATDTENTICYRVWRVTTPSEDGIRLSQQLTTTVATLVVAVAGFYFGTQAVEKAKDVTASLSDAQTAGAPLVRKIDPGTGNPTDTVIVTIKGRNLSGAKSVKLVKEAESLEADNILSNDTTIQCSIKLDKPAGTKWNVVVENARREQDVLEDGFEIVEEGKNKT